MNQYTEEEHMDDLIDLHFLVKSFGLWVDVLLELLIGVLGCLEIPLAEFKRVLVNVELVGLAS